MSIPKDITKLVVRHEMLGAINKLLSDFKEYQVANNSDAAVMECTMIARITLKISYDEGDSTLERVSGEEDIHEIIFKVA
uniref:Phosphatidylcholine transfer protein n=1 Tax=Solanum tuberosum TaxID=4113 RepID=M1AKY2_SOLTU